ncbi:MAG: Rieske 2Fe-2S domain-containing protein [Planctomycetes bacterium]|nr:Rieske 2Fe-2S domain-containing protein [Planctomycetota bacterium]
MEGHDLSRELSRFDSALPVDEARTAPASWYVRSEFLDLERARVFRKNWLWAGRTDQVGGPGDYLTGMILGDPYVVVRGEDRRLRAFYNVCRHHAARIANGSGTLESLVCPYHGWTYDLAGKLKSAPHLGAIRCFDREEFGLVPVRAEEWGPFVFVALGDAPRALATDLAPLEPKLERTKVRDLRFVTRREYTLRCNWKVFVDNYLDGGYHVAHLHKGLAGQLDLGSYRTELYDRFSIQSCGAASNSGGGAGADFAERIGDGALYAWIYPNLMINRYGPMMDVNVVVPLAHDRTLVIFDYYFDGEGRDGITSEFVEKSLVASHAVQEEDVSICESVQEGLASPAYDQGRYAPALEHGMYQFHRLLATDLRDER